MPLALYNSATRSKAPFVPIDPANVRVYMCGPTVYDKIHIGNGRAFTAFDLLVRLLRHHYGETQVTYVRNITDVDDKIIAKALQTGKTFEAVVAENIDLYYKDMAALGLKPADVEPRATENIPLMIAHIEGLIGKGHAYASGGDVYFRVRSFPAYGKLSGQSVDKMLEAVRIDKTEKKEDPLDFALWKQAKPGEPAWPSPWGEGRPGWHIECSCMSIKHLGTETLDIHAGGRDLIFPHHENEIAQAEALTGKTFAKMWIHHGLLTINAQKMSKSLGNFITVQDALQKFSVSAFKLFFLSTHYASSIDYTDEKLADMEKGIARFRAFMARAKQVSAPRLEIRLADVEFLVDAKEKILKALDEDFNTALAVGHFFDLVTAANRFMDAGRQDDHFEGSVHLTVKFLKGIGEDVFGLSFDEVVAAGLLPEEEALVAARVEARKSKDWKKSDELRDLLKSKGILVEDGKTGQTWKRS